MKKRMAVTLVAFFIFLAFAFLVAGQLVSQKEIKKKVGGATQRTPEELLLIAFEKNSEGKLVASADSIMKISYTPNLPLTQGTEYDIILTSMDGGTISQASFNAIPLAIKEAVGEDGNYILEEYTLANAEATAFAIVSLPTNAKSAKIVDKRTQRLVGNINLRLLRGCVIDGKCEFGVENYLNCPRDCPSGSLDNICDKIRDGKCDPDCKSAYVDNKELDVDCIAPSCTLEQASTWPSITICGQNNYFVYECNLDFNLNPFSKFKEFCPLGCVAGKCRNPLEIIRPIFPCVDETDCIVDHGFGNEQWYCNCGACVKNIVGSVCCNIPRNQTA